MNDGLCDICGKQETVYGNQRKIKKLAQDHNHTTGQLRGRLCHKCNIALGLFQDEISILENAIKYLKTNWDAEHEDRLKKYSRLLYVPYKVNG